MTDTDYMELSIELAKKGMGLVNPNPMVGAVIVKDGKIIGAGYHMKYGEPHAERNALANCKESPMGAELYVTLEPCCHQGQTPPCTDAIIKSGIKRVIIGSADPNPLVAGKGIAILRSHDIEVTENILKQECDDLNKSFFHFITHKKPYVVMKYAMTLDGKLSTASGKSQWITGEEARRHVHTSRLRYSGIMVGIGTVLKDDPLLTCRLENGRNPIRIICDTGLATPLNSRLIQTTDIARTIIATSVDDTIKHTPYIEMGCEVITVPQTEGHISLPLLMERLGTMNIDSILLEGGGTLNWSALQSGIVNKIQAYISPKIFGGNGNSPVMGLGVDSPQGAFQLSEPTITTIEKDILLECEVIPCLPAS